jgi:multimeric flavodoxin WrbA
MEAMYMKVLMINGSPNEFGCTYTALSEVAGTLKKYDIAGEITWIGRKPIAGCLGCGGCVDNRRCVLGGGVNEMLGKMEYADALVVGSPVFFASPNGALIALMDRMFMAGGSFRTKPAAAIVSARRGGTTAAIDVLHKYFQISGMPVVSSNYYAIIHGHTPEETRQDAEGMQTMRILGDNMAWELTKTTAARESGLTPPEPEKKIKTSYIR